MDNLTNKEKVAFDILSEVVMTLCDKAIENKDFDDLDYVSDIENVKVAEEKVTLRNGAEISYSEAIEIFKKSVPEEKQQELFNYGVLERVDEHLDETIQKCRNDYEKVSAIKRAVAFSCNMALYTKEDTAECKVPQFSGTSMDRFGYHYTEMVEKYGNKFGQVATEKQINSRIDRMSPDDIVASLTQNNTEQMETFTQQLDFINRNMEAITRLMIADATREINPNLDSLSKKRYTEQLLIGESFEDLSLMAQKWQEVSEKVESLQVDEKFKKKLNDSLDKWRTDAVRIGGDSIKQFGEENNISKKNRMLIFKKPIATRTMSKISKAVDFMVDKSGIKDTLDSTFLKSFILDPEISDFYSENCSTVTNKKTNPNNSFLDIVKLRKEQQEQDIQVGH